MTRAWFFLPFGALVLAGGLFGFRAGWIAANLSEGEVIEAYAARYMQESGAQAAVCAAMPGDRVWLEIRCGDQLFRVNRLGRLVGRQAIREEPGI